MTSTEGTDIPPKELSGCPTLPPCSSYENPLLLHAGDREFILFSFWKTGSPMGLFGSCLLVMLLCILYEAIDLCRNFLAKEHALNEPDNEDSASVIDFNPTRKSFWRRVNNALNSYRLTQATLYGVQTVFNAIIILIFVSFNIWLIISVAIGKAIGYFLFTGSPVVEKTTMALTTSSPLPARRSNVQCSTVSSYMNTFNQQSSSDD
ncbi:hypothetical protein FO519_004627 [Halicephalobus sp. NKZ332]|nr:hypothetical protein FO519_004627 [Halicephalobus sp. NKZ332]